MNEAKRGQKEKGTRRKRSKGITKRTMYTCETVTHPHTDTQAHTDTSTQSNGGKEKGWWLSARAAKLIHFHCSVSQVETKQSKAKNIKARRVTQEDDGHKHKVCGGNSMLIKIVDKSNKEEGHTHTHKMHVSRVCQKDVLSSSKKAGSNRKDKRVVCTAMSGREEEKERRAGEVTKLVQLK
ncbi:hypothetical protein GQ42DRAFT_55087 [Ramicandelaber brevisporus]|nr:hypothetical protein GQ42DRAFT_55087 [Ramicandelaber brevisporus]